MRAIALTIAAASMLGAASGARAAVTTNLAVPNAARIATTAANAAHDLHGFVAAVTATTLLLRDRTGKLHTVDLSQAYGHVRLYAGRPVVVNGIVAPSGVFVAHSIWRTYPDAKHWPADR